jgi:putative alpha-1,2-mannosidase
VQANRPPLFFFFLLSLCFPAQAQQDYTAYVDLFIGTAGDHGQLDPAACVPFGLVKLGPDTEPGNHSGYDYHADKIKGFSHNRLSGTGCRGAGGNLLVKPGVGEPNAAALPYDKTSEAAEPGYYAVFFPTIKTQAELTAANQTGLHRYAFPDTGQAFLMIDLKASFADFKTYTYHLEGKREIVGRVSARNVCNRGVYTQYFQILFSRPVQKFEVTDDKIYALFAADRRTDMELQVTLSPISIEQARLDRRNAVGRKSFDRVCVEAQEAWNDMLGRVEVEGREEYKKLFYTHLYRSLLLPMNSTSTDGYYRGTDGKIYRAEGYTHYDGWSIWDTYRTKLPLITLLYPEYMTDIARSLTDLYRTGKEDWSGRNEPVPTVRTEHALLVLLDAYRKGIRDFDVETAYAGMLKEARKLPYKSPDNILETSYDYWGIAQFAQLLGKEKDHEEYLSKAMNYRKIWHEKFLVMNDRSDIMHGDGLYEGTLWQYRWSVPWDIEGLIEMLGGERNFIAQLDHFFANDLYNHGNQPDIQAPFMFNAANEPKLTQKWVNKILAKEMTQHYGTHEKWKTPYAGRIYKTTPDGFIPEMDDDAGTMSAWFVWAALGLYPLTVGEPVYQLSTPIFERIVIHPEEGKTFTIETEGFSDERFYIDRMELNEQTYHQYQLMHDTIRRGGKMLFVLTDR